MTVRDKCRPCRSCTTRAVRDSLRVTAMLKSTLYLLIYLLSYCLLSLFPQDFAAQQQRCQCNVNTFIQTGYICWYVYGTVQDRQLVRSSQQSLWTSSISRSDSFVWSVFCGIFKDVKFYFCPLCGHFSPIARNCATSICCC